MSKDSPQRSYTEELAEWVAAQAASKRRKDASTVAFLAVKKDVMAALDAGYNMATVFQHLTATRRITGNYETFRKAVRRHITAPAHVPPAPPAEVRPKPSPKLAAQPAGFTFQPRPNPEDIF